MLNPDPPAEPTVAQRLVEAPDTFDFDAALRVLLHRAGVADPAEAVRFASRDGLGFAPADVLAISGLDHRPTEAGCRFCRPFRRHVAGLEPRVTLGLLGLIGVSGVLPRRYSEHAASDDGTALHALLDLLAHRMLAALGRAGLKYRLDRGVETARLAGGQRPAQGTALLAVAGFAEPGVTARLPFGVDALLHYAGLFALRPRSAERLAALASDWLGRRVAVIEFTGAWLPIEPDQRSRLPVGRDTGAFSQLGHDAALGTRAWDPQARVVLRIGPLDRPAFEALLPNREKPPKRTALVALVALVRAYLGFEVGFAVNPVLAAADVPPARLDAQARPGALLGWNTWLGRAGGYVARGDADEARFAAETVERQQEIAARAQTARGPASRPGGDPPPARS